MVARLHVLTYTRTLKVLTRYCSRDISSLCIKQFPTEVLNSYTCKYLSEVERCKFKTLSCKSPRFSWTRNHYSDFKERNSTKSGVTVFSLSSGHGKCGVAVVRVSGPGALLATKLIAQFKQLPSPRETTLRRLIDPETGVVIDKGIVIVFPGPHSFTGEDCVEFQVHGGPAVVSALLTALHKIPSFRQAEPGEFTKRAFMNGKMDLTEVEGLGDLIHAETEAQRRQALRQMEGDLSKLYSKWRDAFIKCAADLEAFIDFGEDQNIEEHILQQVTDSVNSLQGEIKEHLNDKRQGERLRQGVHVVIIGEPNVGKSSLLNAICQRPAAIVTDVAGTTRDVIETHVNIGGYPVLLSDTAGLRETQDLVEKEGVSRAVKRATEADIRVLVVDISGWDMKFMNTEEFLSQHFTELGLNTSREKIDNKHNDTESIFSKLEDDLKINYNNVSGVETKVSDFSDIENKAWDFSNTIIVFNKVDLMHNKDASKLLKPFTNIERNITDQRRWNCQKVNDLNENSLNVAGDISVENLDVRTINNDSDSMISEDKSYDSDTNKGITNLNAYRTNNYSGSLNSAWMVDLQRMKQTEVNKGQGLSAVCLVSCITGEGMDHFLDVLKDMVADMCGNPLSDHPSLTQARHRSHLTTCLNYLEQYNLMMEAGDIVFASEALRCALKEIGKLTGKISSEEILDVIFRDFCIGK